MGKTSLLRKFLNNSFSEEFTPTIGVDFQTKFVVVENQRVELQIWDTAGHEKFMSLIKSFYQSSAAVLIVYAINELLKKPAEFPECGDLVERCEG